MIKFPDCEFQGGSYPCGYKDEGKLPDCELCHKIRKAGIKEVVGWVEQQPEEDCVECGYLRLIDRRDWQAQKKKWGIK